MKGGGQNAQNYNSRFHSTDLLLLLVTGFTLWGTLAFLLAAAALVGVCFFGEKLSGKMAFIGVAVAAVSFLVSALFGAPGMPHFNESAQSDVLMTEENQGDNDYGTASSQRILTG